MDVFFFFYKTVSVETSYIINAVTMTRREADGVRRVAELKMLIFSLGVTRMEMIRNEHVKGRGSTSRTVRSVTKERRCRYGFGHAQIKGGVWGMSHKNLYKVECIVY